MLAVKEVISPMSTPETVKGRLGYLPGDNTAVPGMAEMQEYYVEGVRAHKETNGRETFVPRPYKVRVPTRPARK